MAKVFIGVGHGGNDPGACGNSLKESELNLRQALALKSVLERHNIDVKLSRYKEENDDLSEEIRECNAYSPDLALDMHTNSGGGTGFEVFHSIAAGSKGKTLAYNINVEVKDAGLISRGCKTKVNSYGTDYFGFIRQTSCPAIITEMAFIDNWNDIKNFDEDYEIKKYATCVAKGILKTLNITYKEEVVTPPASTGDVFYRVVVASFKDKANAIEKQEELKKAGFDSFLVAFTQ